MKTFVIRESKWARGGKGGKGGNSALRTELGNKCCLGFLANSVGFRRLGNACYPHELADRYSMGMKPYPISTLLKKLKGLVRGVKTPQITATSRDIALINDNKSITDEERKAKLEPLFAKLGWKPKYVK